MKASYPLILVPAYGRKYKSEQKALSDWNDGKDFKIMDGPMCSIRDLTSMKETYPVISIRWKPHLYVSL